MERASAHIALLTDLLSDDDLVNYAAHSEFCSSYLASQLARDQSSRRLTAPCLEQALTKDVIRDERISLCQTVIRQSDTTFTADRSKNVTKTARRCYKDTCHSTVGNRYPGLYAKSPVLLKGKQFVLRR